MPRLPLDTLSPDAYSWLSKMHTERRDTSAFRASGELTAVPTLLRYRPPDPPDALPPRNMYEEDDTDPSDTALAYRAGEA